MSEKSPRLPHGDKAKTFLTTVQSANMQKQSGHGLLGSYSAPQVQTLLRKNDMMLEREEKISLPRCRTLIYGTIPSMESLSIPRKEQRYFTQKNLNLILFYFLFSFFLYLHHYTSLLIPPSLHYSTALWLLNEISISESRSRPIT